MNTNVADCVKDKDNGECGVAKSKPNDEKTVRFEDALVELAAIVTRLEDGDLGLDDSLAAYETGVKRLKHCHELLARAEKKIQLLQKVDEDGKPLAVDFDDDEPATLEEKAGSRARRRSSKSPGKGPSRPRTSSGTGKAAKSGPKGDGDNNVDEARGLF